MKCSRCFELKRKVKRLEEDLEETIKKLNGYIHINNYKILELRGANSEIKYLQDVIKRLEKKKK